MNSRHVLEQSGNGATTDVMGGGLLRSPAAVSVELAGSTRSTGGRMVPKAGRPLLYDAAIGLKPEGYHVGVKKPAITDQFTIGRPRYFGGAWLSTRCHWTDAEKAALKRFVTERAPPTDAADALGRSPTSIVHYAQGPGLSLPPEWSALIRKRKTVEERGTNRRRLITSNPP